MSFTLPLLEWLDVPAGNVRLQDDKAEMGDAFAVKPFKIAKYPVTNAQYEAFIQDGGYKESAWWDGLAQTSGAPRASDWREGDSPKLQVCWFEAVAFTRWLAAKTEMAVRLATEWEWQWAAVGATGWDYPYGEKFDAEKCNTKESGIARPNVVTQYASVSSPFGAVDMCGNVWEWCLNEGAAPKSVEVGGDANRVLRGGSWNNPSKNAVATFYSNRTPRTRTFNVGFRVIVGEL